MKIIQDSAFNYFIWGGLLMSSDAVDYLKTQKKPIIIKKRNANYLKYVVGINITEVGIFNLSEPQFYSFSEKAYESEDYCRATILE